MGEAELLTGSQELVIRSVFHFYGDASSDKLAEDIARDIQSHWNQPRAKVQLRKGLFSVRFEISATHHTSIDPELIWYNDNPTFNFFRIEEYVLGNISFVDGLNCNTGYFKLDNLLQTSTTAAHEYGHTIGLDHPTSLDIRGLEIPGIMYPRGTICDPHFQYVAAVRAGEPGGTLDPRHRKVQAVDVDDLKLHRLHFNEKNRAVVGGFSSIYHEKHVAPSS
ncbi:MAG: peptidase M10 [Chitinophagaceae bacterium]|nr:peptidase M10 [Chitinophagaceae bacterium]